MYVFFSAVLDTNGKMTTFFVLPILQKLKREGFFYHKEFLKESSSVRNSLRNHHTFLGKKTLGNVVSSSSQVLRKLQKMHFTNSTENGWKKKHTQFQNFGFPRRPARLRRKKSSEFLLWAARRLEKIVIFSTWKKIIFC